MKSSYFTLLFCNDLDKEETPEEMKQILTERIKHLYDTGSQSPLLDGYLAPNGLDEKEEAFFGAQEPDTIIQWAAEMEKLNKDDAWKTIRSLHGQILSCSADPKKCNALSKAFALLGGNANDETDLLLIDQCDLIQPWPHPLLMEDIRKEPEHWALCRIEFQPFE
jgi:hypothetical protein